EPRPTFVLVDAFRLDEDELECGHEPIIRGDASSFSIALASICAKVHRDALMCALDGEFPEYRFADHKGYGTEAHAAALARYGVTPHHRRTFAPIARVAAHANQ